MKMSPQGIMSSEKARNLALAPRQGPEMNSRACLWVLPRPLSPYPMLVNQPTSNPSSFIPPRDSHGRLSSNKFQSRSVPCELIGDIISSYPNMSRDPAQPHHTLGRPYWRNFLLFHINCLISTVMSCGILSPSESQF